MRTPMAGVPGWVSMATILLTVVAMQPVRPASGISQPFSCPQKCKCASLTDPVEGIVLQCSFYSLNSRTNLSVLRGYNIRWLYLSCNNPFPGDNDLRDGSFLGLPSLLELSVDCALPAVSPQLLAGLGALQTLRLTGLAPSTLFLVGWQQPLSRLRNLQLPWNGIEHFHTQSFCGMTHLETLDLSGNKFTSIGAMGLTCGDQQKLCTPCVPQLVSLNASANGIMFVNATSIMADLPQLQLLDLAGNSAQSVLPHVGDLFLGNLQVVDLSNNRLPALATDNSRPCGNSSRLRRLSLRSNHVGHVTAGFFQCTNQLQQLDLSANLISGSVLLEAGLGELDQLRQLDLSHNNISRLYTAILERLSALLEFTCTSCELMEIDDAAFSNLRKLQTLRLNENLLSVLQGSAFRNLTNLIELDLTENRLSSFDLPDGLSALQKLSIAGNLLEHIPQFSARWPSLVSLNLLANNIKSISPGRLSGLVRLAELRMSHNHVTYIPSRAFSEVKNMTLLNLANNLIDNVEYSAFYGLRKLQHLTLDNNRIPNLDVYLYQVPSLEYLHMHRNKVTAIHAGDFPATLLYMDLSWNLIDYIQPAAFRELRHLLAVNLTYNRLGFLSEGSLMMSQKTWLRPQVFLGGNWLECDCRMGWLVRINRDSSTYWRFPLVPDLDLLGCALRLGRSGLFLTTRDKSDFVCSYSKQCPVYCDCCRKVTVTDTICPCMAYCLAHCTCFHTADRSVNVMNCGWRRLTSLPTLRRPYLANRVLLDGNNLTRLTSAGLNYPWLQYLLINRSNIRHIDSDAFNHLKVITELNLQGNHIDRIHRLTFRNISTLQILDLQDNNISFIETGSFSYLTSLRSLLLNKNSLTHLDLMLFDPVLKSIQRIALYENPWDCDCRTGPAFQKWILAHSEAIVEPRNISCANIQLTNIFIGGDRAALPGPAPRPGPRPLVDVDFSVCRGVKVVPDARGRAVALGVLSAIFVSVIAVVVAVYQHRVLLMVFVYSHCGVRLRREGDEHDEHRPYDVFIAHAEEDTDLVLDVMVPELESGDKPYRVCLEVLDWSPRSLTESVVASVSQSKRTLLLVSQNYFQSRWAQYEFQVAHHEVVTSRRLLLIVVLMNRSLREHINQADLRLYMQTNACLYFTNHNFWHKLRYYLPDTIRRDQDRRRDGFIEI